MEFVNLNLFFVKEARAVKFMIPKNY